MSDKPHQQDKLERITRKWWFFLIFVLLVFTLPPYASKGYKFPEEWGNVTAQALGRAIIYSYPQVYPIFKIIPIVLLAGILVFRNKVTRLFAVYVAFSYAFFAFAQNVSVTKKYGVAICTINVVLMLAVAVLWVWEAFAVQNDFTPGKRPIWKYWVVPLMLLAFWYPLDLPTGKPDFNPLYLFTSPAGVAFCLMTPVYVGMLTLYYPKVNITALRVTSLVGVLIGVANMLTNFLIRPSRNWWNGVLHIPLLVISLYGLIISLKRLRLDKLTSEQRQARLDK